MSTEKGQRQQSDQQGWRPLSVFAEKDFYPGTAQTLTFVSTPPNSLALSHFVSCSSALPSTLLEGDEGELSRFSIADLTVSSDPEHWIKTLIPPRWFELPDKFLGGGGGGGVDALDLEIEEDLLTFAVAELPAMLVSIEVALELDLPREDSTRSLMLVSRPDTEGRDEIGLAGEVELADWSCRADGLMGRMSEVVPVEDVGFLEPRLKLPLFPKEAE